MSYAEVETLDIGRVVEWFAALGIEARSHPRHPTEPSPDLALWVEDTLLGYCEVKSLGLGPWDWSNATQTDDGLWEFAGNYSGTVDKTKARLANAVVKASKQLTHAASGSDLLKLVAIVGHGPDTDSLDVQAVMRGFERRAGLPPYSDADNPNTEIVTARNEIDAVLWLGPSHDEHLMLNERDPQRHRRCSELLAKP